jgi:hypothetical protein
MRDRIAFIQPYGLADEGGGPKVLQGLLSNAPLEAISINTAVGKSQPADLIPEIHLPQRPSFGRLEKTRLNRIINSMQWFYRRSFRNRLARTVVSERISLMHAVAHSWDCIDAFKVAQNLKLPFFLTVHDDLIYALNKQLGIKSAESDLAQMWRQARLRFVISVELGEEYCRRYGRMEFIVVTDGLERIVSEPRKLQPNSLRVYFMGLLHLSYLPNFATLLTALDNFAERNPTWNVSLTTRCGESGILPRPSHARLVELPFVKENPTSGDMANADLAYFPLPFDSSQEAFTRYSLSTKMIGYLGSGLPILFHGPECSAAHQLLLQHKAAQIVTSPDKTSLLIGLNDALRIYEEIASAGLTLAKEQFLLSATRRRFWNPIVQMTSEAEE